MPKRLGRYEVRAKVAEGGMATIYLGRRADDADGKSGGPDGPVALKVIKDEFALNREFLDMFLDEAEIVRKLSHPNVVQLYELGTEGARPFIAMELLLGQSLWAVWHACRERRVRLRYDVAAWIGARVAEGLHHAHELKDAAGAPQHVVHRDVNASNIFLTYDGQVKIIDFGLAKAVGRISRTAAGVVKGKLAYMSPEQTVGKPLDRRTDVFALGTTLWEITVDRRLFKGKDDVATLTAVNRAHIPDPTRLVAGYPPELWAVLGRALARDPAKRFATARELAERLDECASLEGRHIGAATLAQVMGSLFDFEQRRQLAWLAEASAVDRAAPADLLHHAPSSYRSMASLVDPPPGMFAPSSASYDDSAPDAAPSPTTPPAAKDPAERPATASRAISIPMSMSTSAMVVTAACVAVLVALAAVVLSRC